jgi:hypothetical protein
LKRKFQETKKLNKNNKGDFMKTALLTAALTIGFAAQSQAMIRVGVGADQKYTTMRCTRLHAVPDLGLSVEVTEGGFAPMTEVSVKQFFLGHSHEDKYVVQRVQSNRIGAPIVYTAEGITLSVNLTTAPLADGGSYGRLVMNDGESKEITELNCKMFAHTM